MKYSIVFPTYNEQSVIIPTLEASVKDLDKLNLLNECELIVVDNASQDRTVELVTEFAKKHPQVRVVRHPRNLGYAMSNLTSCREARGEIIVVVDGDGQLTLQDLPLFLKKLREGFQVVYGWRKERHDPPLRIVISLFLNILSRLLLGWPHHDINCGYRAITREVADSIQAVHPTNYFGPELWVRTKRKDFPVAEVIVQHFARAGGQSIHGLMRLPASIMSGLQYLWSLRQELRNGRDEKTSCLEPKKSS